MVRKIALFILIAFPLCGSGWTTSFQSKQLEKRIKDSKTVLCIYAGEHIEEAKKAHKAYLKYLKTTKILPMQPSLTMFTEVIQWNDRAIVKKFSALPVDIVSILRVYPMEKSFSASITLYKKSGEAIEGFLFEKGKKLKLVNKDEEDEIIDEDRFQEEPDKVYKGKRKVKAKKKKILKPERFREVVNNVLVNKSKAYKKVEEEFYKRYLDFETVTIINAYTRAPLRKFSTPLLGKHKEPLDWDVFYTTVGRKDLAKSYNMKMNTAITFWVIGGLSLLTSPVFLFSDNPYSDAEIKEAGLVSSRAKEMQSENDQHFKKQVTIAIVFAAIGLVSGLTGTIFYHKRQPISPSEAMKLVNAYNKRLIKELKVDENILKKQFSSLKPTYSLTPYLGENTGGLSFGIKF